MPLSASGLSPRPVPKLPRVLHRHRRLFFHTSPPTSSPSAARSLALAPALSGPGGPLADAALSPARSLTRVPTGLVEGAARTPDPKQGRKGARNRNARWRATPGFCELRAPPSRPPCSPPPTYSRSGNRARRWSNARLPG